MKHPIHLFTNNLFFTFLSIIFAHVIIYAAFDITFDRQQVMLVILSVINFIFISISATTTLLLYIPKLKQSFQLTTTCFILLPLLVFIASLIFIFTQTIRTHSTPLFTIPISSFIFLFLQIWYYLKFIEGQKT